MKITIFGATGMVGKHLVQQALLSGHSVRAFGRNPFETFSHERPGLELFKGYLFQDDDIEAALENTEAVLSALGGPADAVDKTRSLGMKKIVAAMEKTGVKRIVGVGGMGILNANEHTLVYQTPQFPEKFKAVTMEHFEAYEYLDQSSLDWTFACPPDIVDAEYSGRFKTRKDYPAHGSSTIIAADLAAFMVKEMTECQFVRCRVGISN